MKRLLVLFVFALIMISQNVWSTIPRTISYQGILTDNSDIVVPNGSYSITFRLYDGPSGGAMLWEETQSVTVASGRYNVILGSAASMESLGFDNPYWLAIKVESDAEMTPRIELSAVGYALNARTVEDDAVTGSKIADGNVVRSINTLPSNTLTDNVWFKGGSNVTITQIADTLFISATGGGGGDDGDWTISGSDMYSAVPGNVGIGTTSPIAPLHVASGNTVLFGADTLGAGSKLMWIPSKSAFRVGNVDGTQWDWANIGDYSTALGEGTTASEGGSTAMGLETTASGYYSTAMGRGTVASSYISTAMGLETTASGYYSTAMGRGTTAHGDYSTSMGRDTKAESHTSMAIGRYNIGGGSPVHWVATDPLFEIGNGANDLNRANAMTVLKNGNVGIRTSSPSAPLHVAGSTVLIGADTLGAGSKLMWLQSKSAFRVGGVNGTEWDWANIGDYSTAMGRSTRSESYVSTAIGRYNVGGGNPNSWIPTDPLFEIGNGFGPSSRANAMTILKNGQVTFSDRVIAQVVEITGGSDFAEPFQMTDNEDIPPGALVIIDDENPGALKLSDQPYDRRVAGVVSGAGGVNPGLTLSQKNVLEDGKNVALAGRVYVKATTSNGPIKPGDLLTTSGVPGHAMKVTNYDGSHGAVIGKAMSSLEEGTGLVLMLVSLQ